ncbi:MAG TPA: HEAT repeat domain-containing protein [Candidatus Rifleibacterium sp.]|nr:HEAT repeat domain-containing protein [Candidatus Rifleibacterium sp.]HPT44850.1 HEAT repeat domain-containing protein [Candidatus Rifleibacterium sp.]
MAHSKTYKVIIPYSESATPRKKFKIEYTVEASDRASALKKAEREFDSYADYNSASWVRMIERDGVRIWKLMPDMPQTPQHIDDLAAQLTSADEDVLYNSLKALGEIEDSSASSKIIGLFHHSNPELVALAVETLGRIADPSNLGAIRNLYHPDTNPRIKACIITAVSRLALPDDDIVGFLTQALREEDARVRANAIEAIEKLDLPDVTRLLLPMLKDEDNRVRANVIKALWNKDDQGRLLEVLKGMAVDENPWMKSSAVFVLGNVTIPGRIELLSVMALDEHPKVRQNARDALFQINSIDCLPYWLEIISNDKEFSLVAEKVIHMGDAALNTLLAFNGRSSESRRHAARLLDMLEQQVLKTSGWISWLKTKQKRLFKSS